LRIKEQGTHLTLHEHDDDDDEVSNDEVMNILINKTLREKYFL